MSYNLRIIQEYFQPKIGRRIRIFSLGRKNNILILKKKSVLVILFCHMQLWLSALGLGDFIKRYQDRYQFHNLPKEAVL